MGRFEEFNPSSYMFPTLISVLQEARQTFMPENLDFVIDISTKGVCDLQIIHPKTAQLFEFPGNSLEFAFVVYLAFDMDVPEEAAKHETFMAMSIFDTFDQSFFQGIPCYCLNLGSDVQEAAKMIRFLLLHVCGISPGHTVEVSIQQ